MTATSLSARHSLIGAAVTILFFGSTVTQAGAATPAGPAAQGGTLALADRGAPDDPEFYSDVLPILQENCQACHRINGANMGGMVAPMSLITYEETRRWSTTIAERVATRSMPPWYASEIHNGQFRNERTLTDDQISTLVRWAETGAASGDPKDAPPPVKFPDTEWAFGEPDLVVPIPEPYFVEDDVKDLYVTLVGRITEEMLPEPRWIRATQVRPGEAVHHVVSNLGGQTPGMGAKVYREGFGQLVSPGEIVGWQLHYNKEAGPGTGRWDENTSINLQFHPVGYEPTCQTGSDAMGNYTFRIPAGDPNYGAKSEFTFPTDAYIISYFPHMHLRGKEMKIMAYYPDGSEEIVLHVPKYDFNWQTVYEYEEFKFVPAGTRLETTGWFDNSAANPHNPDPTVDITGPTFLGEAVPTHREMMYSLVTFTPLPSESGEPCDGR